MNKQGKKSKAKMVVQLSAPLQPKEQKSSRNWVPVGFIFLFAFALYANTLKLEYAFDDSVAITQNNFTKKGIHGIPELLTRDFFEGIYGSALDLGGGRWRPLSLITFAIEYQMFGENPGVSHLINVLLYALTAMLLLVTLKKIFPRQSLLCFLATLFFIAHPVHTEVVANIKSRDEILSFLALVLALFFLFKFLEEGKRKFIILSALIYFIALTSKENGITFLAVIPLTLFCLANKTWKESLKLTLPFFLVAAVFIAIRWKLVGMIGDRESSDIMMNPFAGVTLANKFATIAMILGKYFLLLLLPLKLSCDYSFNQIPVVGWSDAGTLLSLLFYLALVAFAVKTLFSGGKDGKRKPSATLIAFSILFFLFTISIVSNAVFNVGAPMGERFLFLPSLAFCLVASLVLLKIFKVKDDAQLKLPSGIIFSAGIILLLYSCKTIARNPDWKNNKTLFTADVKNAPNSAATHHYLANFYLNPFIENPQYEGDKAPLDIALREERRAYEINPKFTATLYNLGMIFQLQMNGDSALVYFNKVLAIAPTHIYTQSAIGLTYGKLKGDLDKAIYYLKRAVEFNPKDFNSWENLAIALASKGEFNEASRAFDKAISLKPEKSSPYHNKGIMFQNLNEPDSAKVFLDKANAIDATAATK